MALASTANAQTVIRHRIQYTSWITPTVSVAPAYTAKDVVGTLLNFGAVCQTSANIQINSVQITDKSDQAVAYDLNLFNANPSSSTFTDNAAYTVNVADAQKQLPVISLNAADHFSFTGTGMSSLTSLDSGGFVSTTGGTLYGVLITRGTPTYTGTSDISIRVGFKCN